MDDECFTIKQSRLWLDTRWDGVAMWAQFAKHQMSETILYGGTFQKSKVPFETQPFQVHLCSESRESVRCYLNLAVKTLPRLAIVLEFPARWRMQEHSRVIFPRLWLDLFKWRPLPPPWLLMLGRVYRECACTFYRLFAMIF